VHASSGTRGKPLIVAYTSADIELFANVTARALVCAGAEPSDVLHVAYGYGLFTGGLGFHYGGERLGATVVPASGGNPGLQVALMADVGANGLACTPADSASLGDAYPTTHDCPPPAEKFLGTLPIAFQLTTGTASRRAVDNLPAQPNMFCGFCRHPGTLAFAKGRCTGGTNANNPCVIDTHCPGGTCTVTQGVKCSRCTGGPNDDGACASLVGPKAGRHSFGMGHDRSAQLVAVSLIPREGILLSVRLAAATGIDRARIEPVGERGQRFGLPTASAA